MSEHQTYSNKEKPVSRLLATLILTLALPAAFSIGGLSSEERIGGNEELSSTISLDQFDHSSFDRLLRKYVDCDGNVCYKAWQGNQTDFHELVGYLNSIGQGDIHTSSTRESQLAFGINAYNALAIHAVLTHYPMMSVQLLNRKDAKFKIFDHHTVWLGGEYRSLNQIEGDLLRPIGEPRIHFALVCAARGCPRLRKEAYLPERLEHQLTDNALHFFGSTNRFRISLLHRAVEISPILEWYGEDFGTDPTAIIKTIWPWLPSDDKQWISSNPGWKLNYLGYDWALNDQCPTPSVVLGRVPFAAIAKWKSIYHRWK